MQIKKSFLEGKTSLASNYNECKNRAKKFELKRGNIFVGRDRLR
jgi:hypothetical protein